MSDREAFVAAVAANPHDDLPRLVFADWLEEHGDPERAEFIRTQIRWHHADPAERKQLDQRASDLFRELWQRWFGPFLRSISPGAEIARDFKDDGPGDEGRLWLTGASVSSGAVLGAQVQRGFVKGVSLGMERWNERASLADAFGTEPVTEFFLRNGLHSPVWQRFTDPVLRRLPVVHLHQVWSWDVSAPESTAFLEDPHLAGVRTFGLHPVRPNSEDLVSLPTGWVERFTRSALAYRLTELRLWGLSAGGVTPLCRPGRLRLQKLSLIGSSIAPDDVRRLGASELGQTVVGLALSGDLTDGAVAALARDEWPKLRELYLGQNRITTAVLPALASAAFTPQLKTLDLSHNPLFDGTDLSGLERLADALDPDRLEHLNLSDTGLSHVPDFLAERFGERVTV